MEQKTKTWLLIDGHNMAFRCFYGVPQMTTTYGLHVNAIYGWVRSLWKLEDVVRPNAVCVFFDSGGSTARKNILSTYKANRKVMPEELKQQLEYMNLLSVAHGHYITVKEGIEADDLLASFSEKLNKYGETAYIASGDKDFAQCVGERTFQMLPPTAQSKGTWRILDRYGIKENFGVFPEQIVDYLSLLGDSSDNISGIEGIGSKRAEKFLNQFGNIDNLLQNLDKISSEKIRKNLSSSLEIIKRNRELITLQKTTEFTIPTTTISRSPEDIFTLLQNLQLNSLLALARRRYKLPDQVELFDDTPSQKKK
ncbi:MAG: hypothetical protein LBB16_00835 [Puniceicoccales bacterium]|jgi:DNA polymerase-1|nr:hypothetical protein [Puniceicoccales bacterium]